jgi:hypothetical protein
VTDGDADYGKSPLSPLLKSFPKVVSSVSSVTTVWLRGVSGHLDTPNGSSHLLLEAGLRHERTREAVCSTGL